VSIDVGRNGNAGRVVDVDAMDENAGTNMGRCIGDVPWYVARDDDRDDVAVSDTNVVALSRHVRRVGVVYYNDRFGVFFRLGNHWGSGVRSRSVFYIAGDAFPTDGLFCSCADRLYCFTCRLFSTDILEIQLSGKLLFA